MYSNMLGGRGIGRRMDHAIHFYPLNAFEMRPFALQRFFPLKDLEGKRETTR